MDLVLSGLSRSQAERLLSIDRLSWLVDRYPLSELGMLHGVRIIAFLHLPGHSEVLLIAHFGRFFLNLLLFLLKGFLKLLVAPPFLPQEIEVLPQDSLSVLESLRNLLFYRILGLGLVFVELFGG